MTFPKFSEFLQSSQTMRMYLHLGDINSLKKTSLIEQVRYSDTVSRKVSNQAILPLPTVFSHMSFLLIQSLCETGHGEFAMISEKKNHQFAVYPSTHIRDRYLLNPSQVEPIQGVYHQITDQWSRWYSSL
ncbi:MAG: hypothetical protein AAF208_08155 [Cyanobacteria bacterium P01_A01_bin.45]|mgnify:FL=1